MQKFWGKYLNKWFASRSLSHLWNLKKKTQTIKCFTVPNLCNIEWKGKQIHQLPRETVRDFFKKGLADTVSSFLLRLTPWKYGVLNKSRTLRILNFRQSIDYDYMVLYFFSQAKQEMQAHLFLHWVSLWQKTKASVFLFIKMDHIAKTLLLNYLWNETRHDRQEQNF